MHLNHESKKLISNYHWLFHVISAFDPSQVLDLTTIMLTMNDKLVWAYLTQKIKCEIQNFILSKQFNLNRFDFNNYKLSPFVYVIIGH